MSKMHDQAFIEPAEAGEPEKPSRVGRRQFLTASAAAAAATAMAPAAFAQSEDRDYGRGAPPVRYPDPDIVVLDPRFKKYKIGNTPIQRLCTPAALGRRPGLERRRPVPGLERHPEQRADALARRGRPRQRRSATRPATATATPSTTRAGRSPASTATAASSATSTTARSPSSPTSSSGKPLNSPERRRRPSATAASGSPIRGYGSAAELRGHVQGGAAATKEAVYRIDPQSGKIDKVTDELFKPNGLCFSPDYKKLYVADTGIAALPDAPRTSRVYDVDGTTADRTREFADMELDGEVAARRRHPRRHRRQHLGGGGWVGAGYDGVQVFAPTTASGSARSCCRRSAPTSASAAPSATGCS